MKATNRKPPRAQVYWFFFWSDGGTEGTLDYRPPFASFQASWGGICARIGRRPQVTYSSVERPNRPCGSSPHSGGHRGCVGPPSSDRGASSSDGSPNRLKQSWSRHTVAWEASNLSHRCVFQAGVFYVAGLCAPR